MVYLSYNYDLREKTENHIFWYDCMLLVFILIAGLRWRLGVDTPNYLYNFYHEYPSLDKFSFDDYGLGEDPFYVLINSIVKSLGGRFYVVQLIQSSIINILIFKYIKKHSRFVFTSILFYFICYCYTEYNMEIMRGSISIVICLFAYDYIIEKKWLKGILLLFLALMFHSQTLVMFILPLLFFVRLNRIGILFIVGAFIVGILLKMTLGDYIAFIEISNEKISEKATNYVEGDYFGTQIHNLKYMAVLYFPWVFYSICSILYMKKYNGTNPLLSIEPLVMVGVMMVMIQLNFQVAYRFVDYFRIPFILFFSELLMGMMKQTTVFKKSVNYVRTLIFFIPLFFMIGFDNYLRQEEYLPYSSVLNKTIDKRRELNYHSREIPRPDANYNEY